MIQPHHSMLYGTLILTGISIFSQIVGFIYRIFLSRLIGAEIMGLYQLIMPTFSVLLSITAVGLTAAVSNLSSTCCARGEDGAIRHVVRRCLGAFFLLFLPVAAVVILCYDPISVYLLGDARTQLGLLLLLPCTLLTGVENLHKHYFYGIGNVRPPAAVEFCEQLIRTGSVLGLLMLFLPQSPERTVGLIVLGMIFCEIFSAVVLLLLFRRQMRLVEKRPLSPGRKRSLNRRIAAVALPIGLTSLLGNFMGAANAVLIPQRLVSSGSDVSQAMSAFGVLCGMTLPMLCLPTAFIGALSLVLAPKIAGSAALNRMEEIRWRTHQAMSATSLVMMPAMAILVVLGPEIGRFLFQEPSVGCFMLPLSVGVLLSCYQSVLSCVLNGLGKQRSSAWNSILCGVAQLVCTYWLMGLPGMGIKGYVAGFLLSCVLGTALNWLQVVRFTGLRPAFQWGIAPALASILTGLCGNLLFHILLDAGIEGLSAALWCLGFSILLYLAALTAQGVHLSGIFDMPRGSQNT